MADIFDTYAPTRKDIFDAAVDDYGGTPPGTVSAAPAQWKQTASAWYTPTLEAAGGAGGGIVAAPLGPTAAVLGGTLGYAGGASAARNLDVMLGLRQPLGAMELVKQTGEDLRTGATAELGGMVLAPAFQAVKAGGKWVFQQVPKAPQAVGGTWDATTKAVTQRGQEKAAGKALIAHTSRGEIYAANAAEAAELEEAIPGLKFTLGQRTYDPQMIQLERGHIDTQGPAATLNRETMLRNDEALKAYLGKTFGDTGIDDVTGELNRQRSQLAGAADDATRAAEANLAAYPNRTGQDTGERALGAIERAKAPVERAMGQLESEVPDYPMEFAATFKAFKDVLDGPQSAKIPPATAKAIANARDELEAFLGQRGTTTFSAFGVRRALNDRIAQYMGKPETEGTAALLLKVKEALGQDLANVSERVAQGQIKTYRGKPVDVGAITRDLTQTLENRARLAAEAKPDVDAMAAELQRRGVPFMKVLRESDEAYAKRIGADYRRVTGQEVPTQAVNTQALQSLDAKAKQLRTVLQEVEPGSDVAAAMNAYNQYASSEYFGRFDRGAISRATARGGEAGGTRALIENVGRAFTTPSGADDLIRAVGPEEARQVMLGHYAYDLHKNATDDTGTVVVNKLRRWYNANSEALKKYGLDEQFGTTVKMQELADKARTAAAEFEKSVAGHLLGNDVQKAVRSTLAGANAGAKAFQLMEKVQGSKTAVAGLQKAYADELMRSAEVATESVFGGGQVISSALLLRNMKDAEQVLRVLYKDAPEKMRALMQVRRAYQIAVRNTRNPSGMQGSDSAPKFFAELGKRSMTRGKIATFVAPVLSLLKKHGDDAADMMITRALFDPDYAQTLVSVARGRLPAREVPVVIGKKIVDLNAYRAQRSAQAAAGLAAAAMTESNGTAP